jgi:hypothetical protein
MVTVDPVLLFSGEIVLVVPSNTSTISMAGFGTIPP